MSAGRKVPATQPRSLRQMEQVSMTSESSKTSAPQGSTCLASCSATYLAITATILPVGHTYSRSRSVFRTKAEQVFVKFECVFFRKTKVWADHNKRSELTTLALLVTFRQKVTSRAKIRAKVALTNFTFSSALALCSTLFSDAYEFPHPSRALHTNRLLMCPLWGSCRHITPHLGILHHTQLTTTIRGSTPKSKFGKILGLFGAIRGDYLGPFLAPLWSFGSPFGPFGARFGPKYPSYPLINGYKRAIAPNAAPSGMFDRPV